MKDIVARTDAPADSSMFTLLSRAASDPNVDVDKFMRLKQMLDEDEARKAERAFNDALSECQAQMGTIGTNKANSQTHSKYATYDKLDKAIRPLYTAQGFSLSFDTGKAEKEGEVKVLCYVSHKAGHTRTYNVDIPSDGKGAKGNDVMTKTHATGSALSYGQRYLLKGIFNIAVGDQDDDGNAAGGNKAAFEPWHVLIETTQTLDALKVVKAKLVEAGVPPAAMRSIIQTYNRRLKELTPRQEKGGEEE